MNFDFKPKFRIERWREVYPPNGAMLRLWLEQEGYRVYQWADQPGMIYALHKDEKPQSYWIVSGALEFYVGGQTYMLETGDRAFLEPETWHSARVASEQAVVYLIGEKLPDEPPEPISKPKPKRTRKKKQK